MMIVALSRQDHISWSLYIFEARNPCILLSQNKAIQTKPNVFLLNHLVPLLKRKNLFSSLCF